MDRDGFSLDKLLKVQQGYTELSIENLPELIKLKYGTTADAKIQLGSLAEINKVFVGFQKELYAA